MKKEKSDDKNLYSLRRPLMIIYLFSIFALFRFLHSVELRGSFFLSFFQYWFLKIANLVSGSPL